MDPALSEMRLVPTVAGLAVRAGNMPHRAAAPAPSPCSRGSQSDPSYWLLGPGDSPLIPSDPTAGLIAGARIDPVFELASRARGIRSHGFQGFMGSLRAWRS
jgi:hypothetical protein